MTNPPQDDDERNAGAGASPADPDQTLTQPGQPYGQPRPDRPQPYGHPAPGGPQGYAPYGQPPAQPGPPGYAQAPPQYGSPGSGHPGYGQPAYGPPQYGQPGPPQYGYGQPGYGQPGYGPQYGLSGQPQVGPERKSRVGLIAAISAIALLLVLGAVVLVLTLQSTVLDPAAVERDVAAQFEQREGVAVDLSCADDMAVAEGQSYRCTGVTADGEEVTLQITVTDEESAAYTWTEP